MPATDDENEATRIRSSVTGHQPRDGKESTSRSSPFAIPQFVRRLFDAFPLRTFPANDLPANLSRVKTGKGNALFIWTTAKDATAGRASFNPSCLRWQLYLKSRNIPFRTISSNNHASTVDRLPFLLVTNKADSTFGDNEIVSSQDLSRWAANQVETWPKELDMHYDAYMTLLSNEVRIAWQYHLYLTDNFHHFVSPAYIKTHTSSKLVQAVEAYNLRKAARHDLDKTYPAINDKDIYAKADAAFEALDNVLARKMRIQGGGFADREPSLLEATLYSYLFLLLETPVERWKDARLPKMVKKYPELLRMHRDMSATYEFEPPSIFIGGT